jgi:phosphopantothenoylcysteine decarboxylase / phosphopantothenate---cysteine ligase
MSMSVLKNKRILITAGPTREAIDPVRYISNHSSGKMGYAIAEAFLKQGAKVVLVSGPVNIQLQHPNLKLIPVTSAFEMYVACNFHFMETDIAIFAAAVADYKPEIVAEKKIKKAGDEILIKLVKNPDIAFEFGKIKRDNQLSIGFALETNDELINAESKLRCKNFDMIVLNSMNDAYATFEYDTNKVTIIQKDLVSKEFPVKNKTEVAVDIIKEIASIIMQRQFYSSQVIDTSF